MGMTAVSLLPVELEQPIFEMAARADRKNVSNLVSVARRVKLWVDPIRYEVVSLLDYGSKRFGTSSLSRFMSTFSLRPEQFYADHVQHLCLSASTSFEIDSAKSILKACRNVVNLAYEGPIDKWDDVLAVLHSTQIQRLSMELPPMPPDPVLHVPRLRPLLANVTHLNILYAWPQPSLLDLLPNLTHIALCFDERDISFLPLLERLAASESITAVAFVVSNQSDAESGIVESYSGTEDLRFVPLRFNPELVKSDWDASTCGGEDMWYRAEEAVAARMREHRQYFNALHFHDDELMG